MLGIGVVFFGFFGLFAFASAYKDNSNRLFYSTIGFVCWIIAIVLQWSIGV